MRATTANMQAVTADVQAVTADVQAMTANMQAMTANMQAMTANVQAMTANVQAMTAGMQAMTTGGSGKADRRAGALLVAHSLPDHHVDVGQQVDMVEHVAAHGPLKNETRGDPGFITTSRFRRDRKQIRTSIKRNLSSPLQKTNRQTPREKAKTSNSWRETR